MYYVQDRKLSFVETGMYLKTFYTSAKCKSSIKQLYRSWCWYSRPCLAVPRHFAPLVEAQHLSYNYKLQATGYWLATHRGQCAHLPAQDAKDKVHDKKSSQDHHWHKVYKLPSVPHRVVDLFRFCLVLQTIHWFHNQFSQSQRRPLLGPSPGQKRLLLLSHLRHN